MRYRKCCGEMRNSRYGNFKFRFPVRTEQSSWEVLKTLKMHSPLEAVAMKCSRGEIQGDAEGELLQSQTIPDVPEVADRLMFRTRSWNVWDITRQLVGFSDDFQGKVSRGAKRKLHWWCFRIIRKPDPFIRREIDDPQYDLFTLEIGVRGNHKLFGNVLP